MGKGTKRAAALSAAVVGFALVGSGCEEAKDKGSEAASSASSVISSVSSSVVAEPSSGAETSESAAPSTTKIPGADGTEYSVSGPILEKYDSLDQAKKDDLGAPKAEQKETPDGGVFQEFDGGVIIHKTESYVVWGAIRDKWNEEGGSQGELGYPTSDETDTADGGKQTTFEHGTITWKPGEDAVVTKK